METEPPVDFQHYMNWRLHTPEGRAWWRQAVSKHNYRYVCEQCKDVVWLTKGDGAPESMPCPFPCNGTLVKQREPEFWEER